MMPIKIGDMVPDFFAITNQDQFRLKDYRGKYLVLYFYPKDNTPGCTVEANDFTKHANEFTKLNAQIIGVSRDSIQSHQKFCDKQEISFPLIADQDSKVCDLFGVINKKSIFGKTALGLIRSTFLIDPEGKLIKEWRKVSVKGHAQEVLAAIEVHHKPK